MSVYEPEILQDFLIESGELLEELDADLVTLEDSTGDAELLNKVFRALHTIKGSASFLGMANLVAIAHVAEDALNGARKGEVTIDKPFIDAILEAVDILKGQFKELESGQDLTAPPEALVELLRKIAGGSGAVAATPVAAPEPAVVAQEALSEPAPQEAASQESAAGSEDDQWPRRSAMALPAGKSELIDFMVSDLEESIGTLQENLPKLGEPTSRQDAALELVELTEGVSRTVEFFEFAQLGTLVDTINLVAERVCELSDDALEQTMPRLLAIAHLMGEQTQGLKIGEVVTFEVDELCARVVDVMLGHDLPKEIHVGADASLEDVCRTDQVLGAFESHEAPEQVGAESSASPAQAEAAPPIASPEASAPAKAPAGPPVAASKAPAGKVEQTIRVEVSRLEALLNLVGELVIQKNRVGALARSVVSSESVSQDMREAISQGASDLDRITGDIQVAVMRTRMQPLDKIFGKYPRLIRDLARKTGKEMQLVVEGGDVEVDKSVIEELGDPLVHLMRNSADHGIESPGDRKEAGKDEKGTIRLIAVHEGSHVVIQMVDDGAGLSREKLTSIAIKRGLTTEEESAQLSDREVYRFIMAAGFSTASKVSDISGRGVGMDVVRTNIEALKGTIDVDSTPGKGTTITIKIPLTVAIMPAMMVGVGAEQYAVPLSSILEIVMPEPAQVSTVHGRRVMRLRDSVLPLVSVSDLFDVPQATRDEGKFAVVVELNDQTAGLMVEELIGQQEVVVKPLDDDIAGDGLLSGTTVRDDGGVSLIVDIGRMIAAAAKHERALSA